MRLKPKPKEPTNPSEVKKIEIGYDNPSLRSLIELLPDGVDVDDAWVSMEGAYDYTEAFLCYKANKYTPEQWTAELEKYNKRLAEYKEWYEENKKAVNAKLEEKRLAAVKREQNRLKKLLRDKEKIEKQIEKLQS